MTWIAAAATVTSALIGSSASRSASRAQQQAAAQDLALRKQIYEEQVQRAQPFLTAGTSGTNRLMEYLGIGGDSTAQGYGSLGGGFSIEKFREDPFYQYSLNQGIKDLERTAASRGGLLSGATIRGYKDVQGKEYENAFNRYYTGRANTLAPYMSLGNLGTTALGNVLGAGTAYGQGASEAISGMGNARASGYIGSANALTNAISQYMGQQNQGSLRSYLDQVLPEVKITSRKPGG